MSGLPRRALSSISSRLPGSNFFVVPADDVDDEIPDVDDDEEPDPVRVVFGGSGSVVFG